MQSLSYDDENDELDIDDEVLMLHIIDEVDDDDVLMVEVQYDVVDVNE